MELSKLTMRQAAAALAAKECSSVELCGNYLDRAARLDPKLGAFLHLDRADVLAQAADADQRRRSGAALGPFDGVPIAIKDNMTVKGQPCTCASKILANYTATYDATAVRKLKENGLVLFGRANMDEFAMGSTCENSAFKPAHNPWDVERVPGGSSGGSAVAVAAAMAPAALGSDTGGSIRQPAGFCGVVGMKPSYGRVSRYGLVAFASSLDQIGPLTRDVGDTAALLEMICGNDPLDSTSLPDGAKGFVAAVENAGDDLKGVRVGLPKEYFGGEGMDADVKAALDKAIAKLQELGAELVEVTLPRSKHAIATYYVVATAEASANLARFDAVRYGVRSPDANNLLDCYLKSRGKGFGSEVKRRILLGTFVLSSGYYDAYYSRAQKARTLIRQDFERAFAACDVIFAPASPTLPFKLGEVTDPVQMYLADIFTISANLAGICGLSLPVDMARGLPIGAQFLGPAMGENAVLRAARVLEKSRAVRDFVPNL